METTTKICCKCRRELPVSEFYKAKNSKDGYQGVCKECAREYHRKKAKVERPASTDGGGGGLEKYTPRELLEELRRRGYKWSSLWLEKVKVEKRYVKL